MTTISFIITLDIEADEITNEMIDSISAEIQANIPGVMCDCEVLVNSTEMVIKENP